MADTANGTSAATSAASFIQDTLTTIDCNAPLTIDVLAKLMQAQSEFLLTAFIKQLAERDATIAQHTRVIDQLRAENTELRVETTCSSTPDVMPFVSLEFHNQIMRNHTILKKLW